MPYQLFYNVISKNVFDDTCLLELYNDYSGAAPTPVDLNGFVVMRSVDNNEDIFTPIRGHEITAEIPTQLVSNNNFRSDNDLAWMCIFKVNGVTVFTGFHIQEDSFDDVTYNLRILKLRFTDNLAVLKGVPLSDSGGLPWHSTASVYTIIKTILNKTGLTLPIKIRCKICPSDTAIATAAAGMAISKLYTRSFMSDERDFMNCYEVLSEIMIAWGCTLYQYNGNWVIDRIGDRIENNTLHFTYTTADAVTYNGSTLDSTNIGQSSGLKECEEPMQISSTRAGREAKIRYSFNNWPELMRNLDLDEGAFISVLSTSTRGAYNLDNWTQVGRLAYIGHELDSITGTEKSRYVWINGDTDPLSQVKYIKPETYPGLAGDRIRFSISCSTKDNNAGSNFYFVIKCGSYYLDGDGKWYTAYKNMALYTPTGSDSREWASFEILSEPLPADGDLEMRLHLQSGCGTGDETRYNNIVIENINAIRGDTRAKGDFNKFTNTVTTRNPDDSLVILSDAARKIGKGALLKSSGALENGWKRGSTSEVHRFSKLNAFSHHQVNKKSRIVFRGSFFGTKWGSNMPVGYWPNYFVNSITVMAVNVEEINFHTGVWKATLMQLYGSSPDVGIETIGSNYEYNFIF